MVNWGRQFGMPAVGEKGHYDLGITVETLGGHSSVPPPHTGIGLSALLIAELEKNPHPLILKSNSPLYGMMTCSAAWADEMPEDLKKAVLKTTKGDKKAWEQLPEMIIETGFRGAATGPGQGNAIRAMMSTTQATDLIGGGLKVNALPEVVRTVINHRVNIASNHEELQDRTIKTLTPVAKEYNLTIIGFDGETVLEGGSSRVVLSAAFGYYTDPSKVSPTSLDSPAWRVMAGTARGMWASRPEVSEDGSIVELAGGEDLIMSPFMSTGVSSAFSLSTEEKLTGRTLTRVDTGT